MVDDQARRIHGGQISVDCAEKADNMGWALSNRIKRREWDNPHPFLTSAESFLNHI